MITIDHVAKILEGWSSDDFVIDNQGVIRDAELEQYIDFHAHKLIRLAPSVRNEVLNNKIAHERRNAQESEYVSHAALFLDFVSACLYYLAREYYDDSDFHFCIMNLVRHMLQTYAAFFADILGGLQAASLAHLRTIYESYVIAKYIMKYRDLARPFRNHCFVVRYRIVSEFDRNSAIGDLQIRYNELIGEYGEAFRDTYGWTAGRIKERRKRKLSTLAGDVDLGGYRFVYVLSSEMIHASSFSALDDSWTGPHAIAFLASAVELVTNGVIQLLTAIDVSTKTRIILMNILYALREDLFDEPQQTR